MYSFIIIHALNNIIVYSILLSLRMTHVGFGRSTRIGRPRFPCMLDYLVFMEVSCAP